MEKMIRIQRKKSVACQEIALKTSNHRFQDIALKGMREERRAEVPINN